MHMETTHGYYDNAVSWAKLNKTVLPMNIHVKFWGEALNVDRKSMGDPEKNINTGAFLLSRIQKNLPANPSIAQVATLYNNLYVTEVSDYGKRVEQIYQEKTWTKESESPKSNPTFYPPEKLFFMPLL